MCVQAHHIMLFGCWCRAGSFIMELLIRGPGIDGLREVTLLEKKVEPLPLTHAYARTRMHAHTHCCCSPCTLHWGIRRARNLVHLAAAELAPARAKGHSAAGPDRRRNNARCPCHRGQREQHAGTESLLKMPSSSQSAVQKNLGVLHTGHRAWSCSRSRLADRCGCISCCTKVPSLILSAFWFASTSV
jgi:hypothetical protein